MGLQDAPSTSQLSSTPLSRARGSLFDGHTSSGMASGRTSHESPPITGAGVKNEHYPILPKRRLETGDDDFDNYNGHKHRNNDGRRQAQRMYGRDDGSETQVYNKRMRNKSCGREFEHGRRNQSRHGDLRHGVSTHSDSAPLERGRHATTSSEYVQTNTFNSGRSNQSKRLKYQRERSERGDRHTQQHVRPRALMQNSRAKSEEQSRPALHGNVHHTHPKYLRDFLESLLFSTEICRELLFVDDAAKVQNWTRKELVDRFLHSFDTVDPSMVQFPDNYDIRSHSFNPQEALEAALREGASVRLPVLSKPVAGLARWYEKFIGESF